MAWTWLGNLRGPQGQDGPKGDTGPRGSRWYVGTGEPAMLADVRPGDFYLDAATGDVYHETS